MKLLVLCDDSQGGEIIKLCNKYKAGIEIQGFYDPNKIEDREKIMGNYKNILPEKIDKHLHAPFWDLCLGSSTNKIKEVTNFFFDYAYNIGKELDCKSITVHQGYIPKTSPIDVWVERSIQFWKEFFDQHDKNIMFCMENLLENSPETLIKIVDGLKNENIGVNFDVGHAFCNSLISPVEWIKKLGERIKYVHLHDNFGESDDHLGIGKGNMNMKEVLNSLNKYSPDAIWALECRVEDMEDSIKYLIENEYYKV